MNKSLLIGTRVAINIAEGMVHAIGSIVEAEYDDGWLYRVEITGGDDCHAHCNAAGELWACEFEVTPIN